MNLQSIKKYAYICLGSVSLVLGLAGIFLPVLPTTPFLLLASYCYMRSSKRMHLWLIHHKLFGPYIYNYITYKAIPRKTKVAAIISLWTALMISMALVPLLQIRILLALVGICVTVHLLTLKTMDFETGKSQQEK